jgi:hypothetical protein
MAKSAGPRRMTGARGMKANLRFAFSTTSRIADQRTFSTECRVIDVFFEQLFVCLNQALMIL